MASAVLLTLAAASQRASAFEPIPLGAPICLRAEASANSERTRFISKVGEDSFVVGYRRLSTNRIHAAIFDNMARQVGPELVLDEPFVGTQVTLDAITPAADGTWLATWAGSGSPGTDNSLASVKARLFDSLGNPLGLSFQVNSFEEGIQAHSDAVFLADGRFVVVYESAGEQLFVDDVRARIFAADGSPMGDDFIVNGLSEGREPEVVPQQDGGFIVLFHAMDERNDPLGLGVAHFDEAGVLLSQDIFEIFESANESIHAIEAEAMPDFNAVSTALRITQLGGGKDRSLVRLLNLYRVGDGLDFRNVYDVDAGTPMLYVSHQSLLLEASGRKTLVWLDNPMGLGGYERLLAQRFAFKNQPLSSQVSVEDFNFLSPGAVTLSDERAIVVWRDEVDACNLLGRFVNIPELLFADDFESGTTARWDAAVP